MDWVIFLKMIENKVLGNILKILNVINIFIFCNFFGNVYVNVLLNIWIIVVDMFEKC